MLTLHRDSRTIVTDENFSVKLKWVNPCCYHDSIPGDVGLGLEISVNEYTRTEFGNPERFEKFVSGQDRKFSNVSIRFGGFMLMRGTLVITAANNETYSGWLQSELGVLGTAQRDKYITEMAWPTNQPFVNDGSYERDYDFTTIQNPLFWEGKGKSTEFEVEYTDEFGNPATTTVRKNALTRSFELNQAGRVNRMNGVTNEVLVDGDACVVSPFLKLQFVIKEMFRINGFFIDDTSADFDYVSLLVYHNFNIFKQTFTVTPTDISYWDYNINDMVEQSFDAVVWSWSISNFNYADCIPRLKMKDFILSVQNFLNIAFHCKTDNTVKLIDRNAVADAVPYSLDKYFVGHWTPGERKDVALKFVQKFDEKDEIQNDWHDLSDRIDDFGAPVADIAALQAIANPQLGELRLVTSLNKIYEYKWAVFEAIDENFTGTETDIMEWVFVSTGNQPYIYGTSEEIEEIKTDCSTLTYNTDSSIIFPENLYTRQQGNIASSRSLWADFGLRLIYMRDYYNVQKGYLEFGGANGLFKRRWEKWARIWKNRLPVEGKFMLPMNELYYVMNNITQPFSTRHGKFIIEEMECDFQGDLIGLVHIRGYKL